jgi:serine/threonine protein kinase
MEGSLASSGGGATNPRWMAPEVLDGQQATPAADVFAFGVVMWEVLTWDIPWQTEQAFVVGVGGGGGGGQVKGSGAALRALWIRDGCWLMMASIRKMASGQAGGKRDGGGASS